MMRRRTALWIAGLIGTLVLTLLVSVSCGDDEDTAGTAAKVGALEITNAYARGVMDRGAVYFTVKNTGDEDDALTAASTDVAEEAQLHTVVTEGVTARMQPVAEIEIPAKGETTLQPGGYHVMLMDPEEPLEEGDTIEVELTFEKAGSVSIRATVVSYEESDDGMAEE